MLRTRIMTAVVLAPLALLAIFKLSPDHFALAAAALLLVGSWEFRKLTGLPPLATGPAQVAIQLVGFWWLVTNWTTWTADPVTAFAWACAAWLLLFVQLGTFRAGATPTRAYQLRSLAGGFIAITAGWMSLAWLRNEPDGAWWIVVLLLTIWSADIGAYFTGRAWGRKKLAPAISPGKTWAGFWGGATLASLVPLAASLGVPGIEGPVPALLILGAVTAAASVAGDLFISLHKRTVGCKDTGRLFPGHGGVLDRLDSLIAGGPFFVLVKLLAGL